MTRERYLDRNHETEEFYRRKGRSYQGENTAQIHPMERIFRELNGILPSQAEMGYDPRQLIKY